MHYNILKNKLYFDGRQQFLNTTLDRFIPSSRGFVGRPPKDRIALARAFATKAILNLPTPEVLIGQLQVDRALRRICGFEGFTRIPNAARFSRACAEFTEMDLPARVHCVQCRGMGHADQANRRSCD